MSPSAWHNAIAQAGRDQAAFAGETVTYCRGSGENPTTVVLTAIHSPKEYEAQSGYDMVETFQMDDWLIAVADLALGGLAVTPARGDTIRQALPGGAVNVYEVLPLPGRNAFDTEPGDSRYRVHTKLTATEPPPAPAEPAEDGEGETPE